MFLYILSNLLLLALGTLLLNLIDKRGILNIAEKYIIGFILGIAMNSFVLFALGWSGIHIGYGKYIDLILLLLLGASQYVTGTWRRLIPTKPDWKIAYNKRFFLLLPIVLLMLLKLFFSAYQSFHVPSYFDDEKGNWNWKSKNIYYEGVINTEPGSDTYVGGGGHREYPLNFILYDVYVADFMGEWDERYANAITLILFNLAVILLLVSFGNTSWGILTAYLIYSLPLVIWHSGAAYYDLTIAIFYLLSIMFLIRFAQTKEVIHLMVIGILLYSAIFTKNEGMVLVMPSIFVALGYYLFLYKDWKKLVYVIVPLLFLIPHMIFRVIHNLSFNPHSEQSSYGFQTDSLRLYYEYFSNWGSYNIFWYGFLLLTIYLFKDLIKKENFGITIGLGSLLGAIFLVFSFTNNYQFLLDQTTINRTLLIFMVSAIYFYMFLLHKRLGK